MTRYDQLRALDALIGEIEGAGDAQKKTAWTSQAWHRRLTWVRWLQTLRRAASVPLSPEGQEKKHGQ